MKLYYVICLHIFTVMLKFIEYQALTCADQRLECVRYAADKQCGQTATATILSLCPKTCNACNAYRRTCFEICCTKLKF